LNIQKSLEQFAQLFLYQALFSALPDSFPSIRELRIQTAKWKRLIDQQSRTMDTALELTNLRALDRVLGGDVATFKKERVRKGQLDAKIMQQGRHVKRLTEKSFKEHLKQEWPEQGKKYTKVEFRKWHNDFELGIKQSSRELLSRAERSRTLPQSK